LIQSVLARIQARQKLSQYEIKPTITVHLYIYIAKTTMLAAGAVKLSATIYQFPGNSNTPAAPIPVPMHIETTPYDLLQT